MSYSRLRCAYNWTPREGYIGYCSVYPHKSPESPHSKSSSPQNTSAMKFALFSVLLCLFCCSTTLASSSSDSDSERTMSSPRLMDFRTQRKIAHIVGPKSQFILDSSAAQRQSSGPASPRTGPGSAAQMLPSSQKTELTPIVSPEVSTTLTLAPPGSSKGKKAADATSSSGSSSSSSRGSNHGSDTASSTGRSGRDRRVKGKGRVIIYKNARERDRAKGRRRPHGFKLDFD